MRLKTSVFFVFLCIPSLVLFSCRPISMDYYYQQQSDDDEDDGADEDNDWDDEVEEEEPSAGSVSIFSAIRADGVIDEDLFSEYPEELAALKERLPDTGDFSSSAIMENDLICAAFDDENVPTMWYEDGTWEELNAEKNEFYYLGANSSAQGNTISDMNYYAYRGLNPFFSAESSYNTACFGSGDETRMERFVFYRFTGTAVIVDLDNYLVAVDTYTRLFFAFAVPTDSDSILGQEVPTEWGPVEAYCTDPDGKSRKFYEYDPAGYVDDQGNFINAEWYEENLAAGTYDPVFTGLSPYTVGIGNALTVEPEVTVTTLESEGILRDGNGYYTEIEIRPQSVDLTYTLFRLDDGGGEWVAVAEDIAVASGDSYAYRDYDALFLTGYPRYKAEAFSASGDSAGESGETEGSRMLSNEEVLLGALNSIRLSFKDLWYETGSVWGDLKEDCIEGDEGTYSHGIDRNGFFGTNYRRYQNYSGYRNSLFLLDGTFMKDDGGGLDGLDVAGTWTHEGSNWPDDEDFLPRKDELTVEFAGRDFTIRFDDVEIGNNDGNDPDWESGILVVQSEDGIDEYGRDSGFPFVLFMDDESFSEALE